MFKFLKKINNSVSEKKKHFVFTMALIFFVSISTHVFLTLKFAESFKPLSSKAYQGFSNRAISDSYFITHDRIIILDNSTNKKYELKNKVFVELGDDVIPNSTIIVNKEMNINIHYPLFVEYKFDDISVLIKIGHPHHFSMLLFIILMVVTLLIHYLYSISIDKSTSKVENLKVSVQEYALSQRTTSYLVSIIHHKMNTPLKVITTKSRMLIQTIDDSDDIDPVKEEKAKLDYIQLHGALKTMLNVTSKLKSYNELSQNESNIYKLFTISKETINILKDDDFEIDIDYKAKLYDINRSEISSHEIIQIFINQIKISLTQLADKIGVRIFKYDEESITILYSDNGNKFDDEFIELLSNETNVSELTDNNLESDQFDLMLNFNILNDSMASSTKILSSNKNGNVFEIKLPTFRQSDGIKKVR